MKYEPVLPGMDCDLSETSLEEAAIKLCANNEPSPFEYELRVAPIDRIWTGHFLERAGLVNVGRSPLRIHFELKVDESYTKSEWSLHAHGRAFGSKGC